MAKSRTQSRFSVRGTKDYLKGKSFYGLIPLARRVRSRVRQVLDKVEYAAITVSKKEFINGLKTAVENNVGYAAAKIGRTAEYMMYYEILLRKETNSANVKEYERGLEFQCLKQQGIFPVDSDFYLRYSRFYVDQIRNIDCLGLCYYPQELEIIKYYQLKNKLIHYIEQLPANTGQAPSDEEDCYLQYLKNKKILLICPFAEVLKERATKKTFEGVWSRTGKRWFYPQGVDALEFPYGFASETHKKYPTAIDLFKHITTEIDKKDFDIALIAAAGIAIPIASYIKSIGKISIDLGGHLQVLFGVVGKRWRDWENWMKAYSNEYWIDMPAKCRPKETDVCDSGAYW